MSFDVFLACLTLESQNNVKSISLSLPPSLFHWHQDKRLQTHFIWISFGKTEFHKTMRFIFDFTTSSLQRHLQQEILLVYLWTTWSKCWENIENCHNSSVTSCLCMLDSVQGKRLDDWGLNRTERRSHTQNGCKLEVCPCVQFWLCDVMTGCQLFYSVTSTFHSHGKKERADSQTERENVSD